MRHTTVKFFPVIAILIFVCVTASFSNNLEESNVKITHSIVTSDSLLSGMIAALLPPNRYSVEAILPPGQCPGHYDVKLSDIEKMKKALLVVTFRDMPFMDKNHINGSAQLLIDAQGRNWMAPDSHIYGLALLAHEFSKRYPEDKDNIMIRKEDAIRKVRTAANTLIEKIKRAGVVGKPIIASSMQKEPLVWMGFRIVAEYGRPEAMSIREVMRLGKIGKEQQAIVVVDNLQSGPDAGKGIAETLRAPHVVLTNFPSEKGYLATLGENVNIMLAATARK